MHINVQQLFIAFDFNLLCVYTVFILLLKMHVMKTLVPFNLSSLFNLFQINLILLSLIQLNMQSYTQIHIYIYI